MLADHRLPGAVKITRDWRIPSETIPLTPDQRRQEQLHPVVPPATTYNDLKALASSGDITAAQAELLAGMVDSLRKAEGIDVKDIAKERDRLSAQADEQDAEFVRLQTDQEEWAASRLQQEKKIHKAHDALEKAQREWEPFIPVFQRDLAALQAFYTALVAKDPRASDILLPQLELDESFYASKPAKGSRSKGERHAVSTA